MDRMMLRAKIHRATVTETNLDYDGSLTLDADLMQEADMLPFEQVHVYNITNGERFVTYLIKGKKGSGTVGINGAAAHKAKEGDKIIVVSYVTMEDKEIDFFVPKILILSEDNKVDKIK